ncbi:MAG: hypothetical protein QOI58_2317 [Thermoanaerobaculia bacterium]|jgi:dihydrofolate reductase|nr:hypothetical protein [Thermoanaerobaculia bacterium]
MAKVMRNSPKVVVSKKLKSVDEEPNWKNVTILQEIDHDEILKLKGQADITILGSGTIVQQLSNLGVIDEYRSSSCRISGHLGSGFFLRNT